MSWEPIVLGIMLVVVGIFVAYPLLRILSKAIFKSYFEEKHNKERKGGNNGSEV